MKVILVDNFDRESVSHQLVCQADEEWAIKIANILNSVYSGAMSSDWFRVVPDDYNRFCL